MPKSVELVKADKNRNFLACIDRKTEKMSDFERFAFVCQNLSLMAGSEFRRQFIAFLAEDIEEKADISSLGSREAQKALWRKVHGENITVFDDKKYRDGSPYNYDICDSFEPLILNSVLKSGEELPKNIDELAEKLPEVFAIDISNVLYSRPDEYHSALAYQKILDGEECDSQEICSLICWIACRVAMKKKADIYVIADKNIHTAKKLIELFDGRKLYPNIRLCFSPEDNDTVDKVAALCLNAPQKNISSEIVIPEEKIIGENIKRLFSRLPVTRIALCGFLTKEKERKRFEEFFKLMTEER